jgi:manganese transport protein
LGKGDREIIDIKSGNFEFATGFAIIPLIHFVSDKSKMRGFHISRTTQVASWIVSIIVALNGKLVYDEITGWLEASENPIVLWLTVVPLALSFDIIYCLPFVKNQKSQFKTILHII